MLPKQKIADAAHRETQTQACKMFGMRGMLSNSAKQRKKVGSKVKSPVGVVPGSWDFKHYSLCQYQLQ